MGACPRTACPREIPGPGQESVWDYPRPPACLLSARHVVVRVGDFVVADSTRAYRVLETSHPPTWYLPRADVDEAAVTPSRSTSTWCEWKGAATYWDVRGVLGSAWSYEQPTRGFGAIAGFMTFYPSRFECSVDGERVRPQDGGFYGGWITDDVVGPFKGGPAPGAGEARGATADRCTRSSATADRCTRSSATADRCTRSPATADRCTRSPATADRCTRSPATADRCTRSSATADRTADHRRRPARARCRHSR